MKRVIRIIVAASCVILLSAVVGVAVLNWYVCSAASGQILDNSRISELEDIDCILVLGCSVKEDGSPSVMLRDRVETGIALYKQGAAGKLLMSGDHGQDDYNEVQVMKDMAVAAGIPAEDVFMDHAGFSTYESMYRARDIFQARRIVIVTQEYHLYRAIYVAKQLGLTAYGVSADRQEYGGQWARDLREAAARVKDCFTTWLRIRPAYLGDAIPVQGNGNQTDDRETARSLK